MSTSKVGAIIAIAVGTLFTTSTFAQELNYVSAKGAHDQNTFKVANACKGGSNCKGQSGEGSGGHND